MMIKRLILVIISVVFFQPVYADCEVKNISVQEYNKSSRLGQKLHAQLERYQPKLAIVARIGSDLSKYNLKYSHAGIVMKNHPKGRWIFTHLLRDCKQQTSSLLNEGVINFFLDDPFQYQALLVIPKRVLQNELENLILSGKAKKLHEKRYSMIANPNNTIYQNSNQWILELIAVSKSIYLPEDKRKNAIQLAQEYGYQPEIVKIGLFKKMGILFSGSKIPLNDHGKNTTHYPFVSVKSIVKFLKLNSDIDTMLEISLNDPVNVDQSYKRAKRHAQSKHEKRSVKPAKSSSKQTNQNNNQGLEEFWQ